MSNISRAFSGRRKALVAYVTGGYPSIEATETVVPLLAESGCDIVEIGIPFSDPLADGATIQRASFSALHNGVTSDTCFEVADRIRTKTNIPLIFMTYFNPVLATGLEHFVDKCARTGIDGLIVPDLPPEEGMYLESISSKKGIDLIYLLAPTSTPERIATVSAHSRGFIYLVSVAGVTGSRGSLPPDLPSFVSRVRNKARLPLCVGFGISTKEQAREVTRFADGVIVGSRLVQMMEKEGFAPDIAGFIRELRSAIDAP